MQKEIAKTDVVKLFSEYVSENKIQLLSSLLASDGVFETQLPDLETTQSNKETFLNWLSVKLKEIRITDVFFDQCIYCAIGSPVVIFNDGQFPRVIKDASERSKTGLMLEVTEGKITYIKFCYLFVKTENKYKFQCKKETIKYYMDQGFSFDEAYRKVKAKEGLTEN